MSLSCKESASGANSHDPLPFTLGNALPLTPNMSPPLLSDLELARLESPGTPDAQLVVQLAQRTINELGMEPPISHEVAASLRGVIKVEEAPIPWAGCLVTGHGGFMITLRSSDCWPRKRFTAFHEIKHTFLPGFGTAVQYRCDPATPVEATQARDRNLEELCDIGAAELLLPRTAFSDDLVGNAATLDLVEKLAARYDASLEATARRLVSLRQEPTMLISLEPGRKPSAPAAEPVLRVKWVRASARWPYVPRYKSVPASSIFGRTLQGEPAEEIASLGILASETDSPVHVSARLYPYADDRGEQHMRVLALITPASKTRTSHGG